MDVTIQAQRPRGRRPGRTDTRGVIQGAAYTLFSELGYEKVSLRAIARAAEVDPALIHHYFDNKADLFSRAVLDRRMDAEAMVERILGGPQETIGERTVLEFLEAWDIPGASERFTAMIRAGVNDPDYRRPMSEFMSREVLVKVAEASGHANAKFRAQLALSLLLGLTLSREVFAVPALVKARHQALARPMGRAMQSYLVDSW